MQGYEAIFVLDPNATDEAQTGMLDKFKALIEAQGGKVVQHAKWGRRKLAYEVKKRSHGIYHLYYIDHSPKAVKALETQMRVEENVLKWMSIAVEDVEAEHAAFEKLRTTGSISQTLTER